MFKLKMKSIFAVCLGLISFCGQVFAQDEQGYSGVYHEYQLIPNRMADLCKVSAEDIVNNPAALADCISRLALKRRSSDAETSREGLKELKEIETEQLVKTMGLATVTGAAVADYYLTGSEEVAEANKEAKTINDVDGASVQTTAVLTSVVNSMRDLYVEQLKYLAISNIENIDKATLEAVASPEALSAAAKIDAEKQTGNNETDTPEVAEAGVTVATVHEETPANAWIYKGDGICELCVQREGAEPECRQEPCPDGTYKTNDPKIGYECKNGECEKIDIAEEE